MQQRRALQIPLITAVAAASLMVAACAGTTDDGDGSAEPDHQPQLLASGVHVDEDGEATGLLFGHTADESWTFELIEPEEMQSRRQAQMGGNGGNGGDGGDGDDGEIELGPGRTLRAQFIAGSGAKTRFANAAQSVPFVRFAAVSDGRSRFAAESGASSRFETAASEGTRRCDPTSYCEFIEALCENYPEYSANNDVSCGVDSDLYCRRYIDNVSLGTETSRAVCAFSSFFRCAARGIRSYGRISTDRGLQIAARRGLKSCRADRNTAFRVGFFGDSGDGEEDSNEE